MTENADHVNFILSEEPGRILVEIGETRIDAAIATQFKDQLRRHVLDPGPDLVIDLAQVEFLDSSGLGALIAIHKALHTDRKLALVGLTPNVERVFRLTHMDRVFTILPAANEDPQAGVAS